MENKIISKIKKLFALSESSNENEAKVALIKAQELLAKHKLSIKEIKEYQDTKTNVIENKTNVSFTKAKWKGRLAYVIAENFGCYSYFKTRRNNTVAFMGKDEDVTVCTIVLEYAIDCINNTVKKLKYQYYKKYNTTKGLENDYALGFIAGLENAFEKQKISNQQWNLVLVKDPAVIDRYNDMKFKGSVNTSTKFKGFNQVYEQGVEDGEKFSVTDKIAEVEEKILIGL
ncbi:DUF2786 domain-containing protein [Tepidibacter aestuarii]|uniref:DUF2786 domain-containing protein n=1 Tax=Tepidibacter aestuarii TaxID=2925782 RepID=UPI0020BDABBE|nr:DUF2786 domain-containing protein [Tepidibacter aestuarii]CAH2213257.1 DUF2786 domain-containing protein [Tepidibacter aestuarii]